VIRPGGVRERNGAIRAEAREEGEGEAARARAAEGLEGGEAGGELGVEGGAEEEFLGGFEEAGVAGYWLVFVGPLLRGEGGNGFLGFNDGL